MKILLVLLFFTVSSLATEKWEPAYTSLLQKYVSENGVRYGAWKANPQDLRQLNAITDEIASAEPSNLSKNEQLAFYINAYNAWTLRNVLEVYPLKSVCDLYPNFGFFSRESIILSGKKMSLETLEKEIIIARFQEPRIHAAINCASKSCPALARESYTASDLSAQLDAAFRQFVNQNPLGVTVAPDGKSVALSSIFKWYAADFAPHGGAVTFINQFRKNHISPDLKLIWQDYDWALNETP